MKTCEVVLTRFAEKRLKKIPPQIRLSLLYWIEAIEESGIREVRKIAGYHDEPLLGDRRGQRSIRLNRAYRAIYEETENGDLLIITVIEVSKHEY